MSEPVVLVLAEANESGKCAVMKKRGFAARMSAPMA